MTFNNPIRHLLKIVKLKLLLHLTFEIKYSCQFRFYKKTKKPYEKLFTTT